jgi:hypothetical protein
MAIRAKVKTRSGADGRLEPFLNLYSTLIVVSFTINDLFQVVETVVSFLFFYIGVTVPSKWLLLP